MGLFIQQNENRSKLQERLAADLREKAALQAASTEPLDQTKDSNYVKDMEQASSKAWLWLVLCVVVVAGIVFFVTR